MIRRRQREKMGVRESSVIMSESHKQWIRGCVCAIAGRNEHVCEGPVQAAHVRLGNHAGMSQKPGDDQTYPLCMRAHTEQHAIGERSFQTKYGFDALETAARYWKASPARIRMERKKQCTP